MRKDITLSGQPVMLEVTLEGAAEGLLKFMVIDPEKRDTAYQMRLCELKKGAQKLYVRMPLSPKRAQILMWRANDPKTKGTLLPEVRITQVTKKALPQRLDLPLLEDATVASFLKFSEEFSQKAGYISASGSIYKSDDDKFTIVYFDTINGSEGKPINTPARVNQNTGVIEISAQKFRQYSIPMRMAILLHEFSHYWLNKDMSSETEADLNALQIYLGLGYPRLDATNVFLNVFMGSPSEANKERWQAIKAYINNFELSELARRRPAGLELIKKRVFRRGYVNLVGK